MSDFHKASPSADAPFHAGLFRPARIGKLPLKNRIVKSPQTTGLSNQDGTVTRRTIDHYKRLAEGGVGLVIVEYTYIDDDASKSIHAQPGLSRREHIAPLGCLVDEVHAAGAKVGIQIEHCGRQRFLGTQPIKSASDVSWDYVEMLYGERPKPMTLADIDAVVEAFGDAAQRAALARFDLLEVHAGHGYLITNFLSPHTNHRTDDYGGSFENRARLLMRVVANIRAKIPADMPLSIRLSVVDYEPDGIVIEETVELCRMLERAGVDVIHASGGHHALMDYEVSPWFMPRTPHRWGWEKIREAISIPLIASGSIVEPDVAEEIIASGSADFVSLGRPLLADPDWALKAREGRKDEITPCIRCNDGCLHRGLNAGRSTGCAVNPSMGNEYRFPVERAQRSMSVAVIGGGPAGLKAAITMADRGHDVTLFDPGRLGGALHQATRCALKMDLRGLLAHLVSEVERRPIKIVGEQATFDTLRARRFERIQVATGRRPRRLSGLTPVDDVETFQGFGSPLTIIGGGIAGCDAALRAVEAGLQDVTIVERSERLLSADDVFTDQGGIPTLLAKAGVRIRTSLAARVREDGSIDVAGDVDQVGVTDGVVLSAIGYEANRDLFDQLIESLPEWEIELIGTARAGTRVMDALHDGFFAGRRA